MATTFAGRRLTEAHRLAQLNLGADTANRLLATWAILDPEDLDAAVDQWLLVVIPLIQARREDSARMAEIYLRAFRTAELGDLDDGFGPVIAGPADPALLATSLTVTGPIRLKGSMARGEGLDRALDLAKAATAAAALRHVLNGGRETVLATVSADPRAQGWARVTSGSSCDFCSTLAGRVYRAEDSASFQSHDRCSCAAEPAYR